MHPTTAGHQLLAQEFAQAAGAQLPISPVPEPETWALMLAGGVIAGVIGPEIATATHDLFAPVEFVGSFVALAVVAAVALLVVQFVDIPVPSGDEWQGATRPLLEILSQPKAAVAVYEQDPRVEGLVLHKHGIFTFGASARA